MIKNKSGSSSTQRSFVNKFGFSSDEETENSSVTVGSPESMVEAEELKNEFSPIRHLATSSLTQSDQLSLEEHKKDQGIETKAEKKVDEDEDEDAEEEEKEYDYLNNRIEKILQTAQKWRENFFDLCYECIDGYNPINRDQNLRRLEIYLGPKVYPCLMKYKERVQLLLFQSLKIEAEYKLWHLFFSAIDKRIREWKSVLESNMNLPSEMRTNPKIILSVEDISLFNKNFTEEVVSEWKVACLKTLWEKFISQLHNEFDEKKHRETVEIKVNRSLKTQYGSWLMKILNQFENDSHRRKFGKTGALLILKNKVSSKIRQYEERLSKAQGAKETNLNNVLKELNTIKKNFQAEAVAFINNDIKELKESKKHWYKDKEPSDFIELVMDSIDVGDELFPLKQKFISDQDYQFELIVNDSKVEKNVIYISVDGSGIKYRMRDKKNEIIEGTISHEYLKSPIPRAPDSIQDFTCLFPDILKFLITTGKTYAKGNNTLLHYTLKKFTNSTNITVKNLYLDIINLLFDHGSSTQIKNIHGKTAFEFADYAQHIKSITDHREREQLNRLAWKILLKDLKSVFTYSLTESQMKKVLADYATPIPELFTANKIIRAFKDWHRTKRDHRYGDVLVLKNSLIESIESLDDDFLRKKIKTQKKSAVRAESSTLFRALEDKVISPTENGDLLTFRQYDRDYGDYYKERNTKIESKLSNSRSKVQSLKKLTDPGLTEEIKKIEQTNLKLEKALKEKDNELKENEKAAVKKNLQVLELAKEVSRLQAMLGNLLGSVVLPQYQPLAEFVADPDLDKSTINPAEKELEYGIQQKLKNVYDNGKKKIDNTQPATTLTGTADKSRQKTDDKSSSFAVGEVTSITSSMSTTYYPGIVKPPSPKSEKLHSAELETLLPRSSNT